MKDGKADFLWENAVLLDARGEVGGENLAPLLGMVYSLLGGNRLLQTGLCWGGALDS